MRALLGDWSPWLRDPIDLAQLSILAGAIFWFATGQYSSGARFLLTWILLVVVSRVLKPPRLFDVWLFIGMSLQAWGNAQEAFNDIGYYDELVHGILTGAISGLIYIGLVRLSVMFDPEESGRPRHAHLGTFLATMAFGMAVGVLYEIYEYAAVHTFSNRATIEVGYGDTIFDLIMDTAGGAAGGLVLAVWAARGWSTTRRLPRRQVELRQDGGADPAAV